MDEEAEKQLTENAPADDEFNRTIMIQAPEHRKGREKAPQRKTMKTFVRKKMEVGDIIGHMDISQYTDTVLDTSGSPLPSSVSTR